MINSGNIEVKVGKGKLVAYDVDNSTKTIKILILQFTNSS